MVSCRRAGISRRALAAGVLGMSLAGLTAAPQARAQQAKLPGPVKILVGFAAGGQSDLLARFVADKMKDTLGTPVVVENKTGAGGRIAVAAAKTAPADGTTLVLANISHMSVAPSIYKDLPYDPVKDFTPIGRVADFQIALTTGKQTGAKDFKALLAWLKANPDKASSGNPGSGSLPHLYGFELGTAAGIKLTAVPYRGGSPIVAALNQGELAMGWASITDFIEQHRAGKMHIVAVTGSKRSAQLPETPTFAELGYPSVSSNGWIGLFGPAAMKADVVATLHKALTAALADASVAGKMAKLGMIVAPSSGAELAAQAATDRKKWQPVIDKAGIKQ